MGCSRTHPDASSRTQNPVVREHHVGSSPTSRVSQEPIKPPSHGGGQGVKSPRVHFLFVAICRLNAMIKRRRGHALGLCAVTQPALRRERGSYTLATIRGFYRGVCFGLGVRMPSAPPAQTFLSTSAVHNHPPPPHVVSSSAARRPSGAIYAHLRWRSMQDPTYGLPRIYLPSLYEKSSCAGQPPQHEATHGSIYQRFAART